MFKFEGAGNLLVTIKPTRHIGKGQSWEECTIWCREGQSSLNDHASRSNVPRARCRTIDSTIFLTFWVCPCQLSQLMMKLESSWPLSLELLVSSPPSANLYRQSRGYDLVFMLTRCWCPSKSMFLFFSHSLHCLSMVESEVTKCAQTHRQPDHHQLSPSFAFTPVEKMINRAQNSR